jgi:hypothetical protein
MFEKEKLISLIDIMRSYSSLPKDKTLTLYMKKIIQNDNIVSSDKEYRILELSLTNLLFNH